MSFLMYSVMSAVLLFGSILHGEGTQLRTDGKISFEADRRVTFGASYSSTAVKATVVTSAATNIQVRVDHNPRNVFVNSACIPHSEWAYEEGTQLVSLAVPGGTSSVQIRFDDLASLEPFTREIPVYLCTGDWDRGDMLGRYSLHWETERVSGVWQFAGAPSGIYEVRCRLDGAMVKASQCGLSGDRPVAGRESCFFFSEEGTLSTVQSVEGKQFPFAEIELRCLGSVVDMVRIDKAERLSMAGLIAVEAEAFVAEGGGAIRKSREHGNTHGGECIFTWAQPGHWIEWEVEIPATGLYSIAFMAATQEEEALRSLEVDGVGVEGASVLRFSSTGGWGRGAAEEWQLFEPVSADGSAVGIRLTAGKRLLRMTNLLGQHCNLDVILLCRQEP